MKLVPVEFLYGKTYVIERTETSITAFEVMSKGKDFIYVYVRKYTPKSNELESFVVRLHVSWDDGEWVKYNKNIYAHESAYQGKLCLYTKEGLKEFDSQRVG